MIRVGYFYSVNPIGEALLRYNNDNTNLNYDGPPDQLHRTACKLNESPTSNASSTTASQGQGQGQTTASQGQGQTTLSYENELPACSSFENITNARTLCNEQSHCIFK